MRVLKIRGKNLASLETLEVDFQAEPLAGASTFAITGPKGAGKTTILDALCLALYGRTPRLRGGGHAIEENGDALSRDPRSILRRGKGECWAEVTFVGQDGGRYRSTWRAWRARKKPGGRFQAATLTLVDADTGQDLGDTRKTQTLEAIEAKVGLSYEQFTRAVLLAQGKFAAFLESDSDTRAKLLEQIAGGELYTQVSRLAFARAREVRRAVEQLESRMGENVPMAPADREQAVAEVTNCAAKVQAAQAKLQDAQQALAWHDTLSQLRAAETAAQSAVADAARALEESRAQEEMLRRVEAAQEHRGVLKGVEAAEETLRAATAEHDRSTRALDAAKVAQAATHQALDSARVALEAARGRYTSAKPKLDQAAALDQRIQSATQDVGDAQRETRRRADDASTAQAKLKTLDAKLNSARGVEREHATWCAEHACDRTLADDWALWDQLFVTCVQAVAAQAKQSGALGKLWKTETACEAALTKERQAFEAAEAERARAEAFLAEVAPVARAADLPALQVERSRLGQRKDTLTDLGQVAKEAQALESECSELGVSVAESEVRASEARRTAKCAEANAQVAEGTANALSLQLERAQATSTLASRRHLLSPGEPCMLCGATDHPYALETPRVDEIVASLAAERDAAQAKRVDALRTHADAIARAEHAEAAAADAAGRLTKLRLRTESLRTAWSERAIEGFPTSPSDPEALSRVTLALTELEAASSSLARREELALEALETERQAISARDAASAAADTAANACRQAQGHLETAVRARQTAEAELGRAVESQVRAVEALDPILVDRPAWAEALGRDPQSVRGQAESLAAEWRARVQARELAQDEVAAIEPLLAGARAKAAEKTALSSEAQAAHQKALSALEALTLERAGVLSGRSTAAVEVELTKAIQSAEQARDQASSDDTTARAAHAAALEAHSQHAQAHNTAAGRLTDATEALQASLTILGVERAVLRELLTHDAAWLRTQRHELANRRQTLAETKAVLAERKQQTQAHATSTPPTMTRVQAGVAVGVAKRAAVEAQEGHQKALLEVHSDDRARAKAQALQAELRRVRSEGQVWLELNQAIGSEDGKALRVFVQSLSFELLVEQANLHLAELARRYRLAAVRGQALNLQVYDLDMGGTIRSVNNLSGGETFLVSLALALGLASLTSRKAQVHTLFIDEGFGTLDPSSLEIVINALDALQSSGRQVGVISHVPALAERLGAEIEVQEQGGGRSTIRCKGAAAPALPNPHNRRRRLSSRGATPSQRSTSGRLA